MYKNSEMNKNIRNGYVCGLVLAACAVQGHDGIYQHYSHSHEQFRQKNYFPQSFFGFKLYHLNFEL